MGAALFCPLMSGQVVPVNTPGLVQKPNQLTMTPIRVPCDPAGCALWDTEKQKCSILVGLVGISELKTAVDIARVRIIHSIENIGTEGTD